MYILEEESIHAVLLTTPCDNINVMWFAVNISACMNMHDHRGFNKATVCLENTIPTAMTRPDYYSLDIMIINCQIGVSISTGTPNS